MKEVYVIDALRTPIGRYGGVLSSVRPDDLAACVIRALVQRNEWLDVARIEEVVLGAANQSGEDNRNVGRMALLLAGLPPTVAGTTVNRLCASGLDAIMYAARAIRLGDGDIFIAGGTESMSRAPFVTGKSESAFSRNARVFDTTLGWRFVNKQLADRYFPFSMGETAENVAKEWKVSRAEQDAFALRSQQKYRHAYEAGKFKDEIVGVEVVAGKEMVLVTKDEHPRDTTPEKLASLKPAFADGGTVTAGNASGINDGAAGLLLVSGEVLREYSLRPMAKVVSMAVAGVNPSVMGIGPVPATNKALQRAKLNVQQLDLIELNEAFAAQSIACIRDLKLDPEKVNVNGGAIALGHPLGCSGARITVTLLHEMRRRKSKLGLATMCVGVGQGAAMIFENAGQVAGD